MSKTSNINKILIANRGEIALRIIASAHKMGIRCVAIYSDSDKNNLHVQTSDEAYPLNGDLPSESYLDIEKILTIAKETRCDAIHPGYGFLAENAAFSEACDKAGIIFIGPRAETISLMGDKAQAKSFTKAQGVPVIPGEENLDQDFATIEKVASEIGVPLLLKASAGGGGKGMKLVRNLKELKTAYDSAKREAMASFGDDTLLVEKYFDQARHIEIQVLADQQGNIRHLYDRDCSLQRRHQKVIEEAPAYGLSDQCRAAMQENAIKLCQAINYQGAGTLEFLVDENEDFYLMEMNTRLQVEHAVSEQVCNIDLVEQQILVAQGETISFSQDDIKVTGHSVEARIYAEQCHNDFLPASGTIQAIRFPRERLGLRLDHALQDGDEVSSLYDPMIAKVTCWGETRDEAIKQLNHSLDELHIIGPETNRVFLQACLSNPKFIKNEISTKFIETQLDDLLIRDTGSLRRLSPIIYRQALSILKQAKAENIGHGLSPWYMDYSWRLNSKHLSNVVFIFEGEELNIKSCDSNLVANHAEPNELNDKLVLHFDVESSQTGQHQASGICFYEGSKHAPLLASVKLSSSFGDFEFNIETQATGKENLSQNNKDKLYLAPLNGRVIAISCKDGDCVEEGQELMVIEAMKMEHVIKAKAPGQISQLNIETEQQVSADQLLFVIDPEKNK